MLITIYFVEILGINYLDIDPFTIKRINITKLKK